MTSHVVDFPSVAKTCAHVKHLGYATSKRIRLYGEEFEVVSDPFPDADGIAVHVTTKKDPSLRVLRLPVTVLHYARTATTPPARISADVAIVEHSEKASVDKSSDQYRCKGCDGTEPADK